MSLQFHNQQIEQGQHVHARKENSTLILDRCNELIHLIFLISILNFERIHSPNH